MVTIRRMINRLPKVDYNGIGNSTEIVIQEPKTKNSIRTIPLMPVIINELIQWKNVQLSDAQTAGEAYNDSGFILNTVDFDDLSVEADNIQYGISCIHSAISQRMLTSLLPEPTLQMNLHSHLLILLLWLLYKFKKPPRM